MKPAKTENKKIKVHYMPTSEMCLDYSKLEEESNWSMSAFSTVPTFLTLFFPSSFVAILM